MRRRRVAAGWLIFGGIIAIVYASAVLGALLVIVGLVLLEDVLRGSWRERRQDRERERARILAEELGRQQKG